MQRTSSPRYSWAIFVSLLVLHGGLVHGALTLVSGQANVSANASANGEGDPKSDSAERNVIPGNADLSVRSVKAAGQNAMQVTGACTLESRDFGSSISLSGAVGASGAGLTNNTSDPIVEGIGGGSVKYTFTVDSEYQWTLFAVTRGSVQNRGGENGNVNRTDNNATVRFQGIFELSISGTDSKQQELSGTIPAGTYTIEGIAQTAATGSQFTSANVSFGLQLTPTNSTPIRWKNAQSGSFQTATNWDTETIPTGNDSALFNIAGAYTVSFDTNASHRQLQVHGQGTNVTLDLGPNSYTLSELVTGGLEGDDTLLTFQGNGGIVSAAPRAVDPAPAAPGESRVSVQVARIRKGGKVRFIGGARPVKPQMNVDEEVTVRESGTVLQVTELNVGLSGSFGLITLADSGRLESGVTSIGITPGPSGTRSTGAIFLSSGGSWLANGPLTIGKGGSGVVSIGVGSSAVAQTVVLGKDQGSTGTLGVRGANAKFKGKELNVGSLGTGELSVTTAGAADVETLNLLSGSATVTGVNSLLNVNKSASVGGGDVSATLIVEDNAKLTQGTAGLVFSRTMAVNKRGKLIVRGSGLASTKELRVGNQGEVTVTTATLNSSNAIIASGGNLKVEQSGAFSAGASLQVDGTLTINADSAVVIGGGASDSTGEVRINSGVLKGSGRIIASEIVVAGSGDDQFTGEVRTGNSPGTLTLEGNFRQEAGGALIMEIAGTSAGLTHDQLVVTGNVSLGGKLVLQFIEGFLPKQGDQFVLLDVAGAMTGDFDLVEVSGLEPGFEFDVVPDANGRMVLTALNDGVALRTKGKFRGVLTTDPSSHLTAGFFEIQLSARGGFSAVFVLGGRTFKTRGKFDSAGRFTTTIPRRGTTPLTISLVLSLVNDERAIVGTISDGDVIIQLSLEQAKVFDRKDNPAPQAGKYTVLLQFDSSNADAPLANGFGIATVTTAGKVRFAGALSDGVKLSQSTTLSRTGEWPLFVLLYKKQGSLVGTLQFRDETGSDFDGLLRWSRPPTSQDDIQTAEFLATLPTIGSRYVAPPVQPAILNLPTGATATLSDVELTPGLTKSLTLVPPDKFVVTNPGPDQFTLRATAANGLLFPQFIHPVTGKLTNGRGVVFQKQNLGSGFYSRPGQIGAFELQPNASP